MVEIAGDQVFDLQTTRQWSEKAPDMSTRHWYHVPDYVPRLGHEFYATAWDRQIEEDAPVGKLDRLAAQALKAFESGSCSEL